MEDEGRHVLETPIGRTPKLETLQELGLSGIEFLFNNKEAEAGGFPGFAFFKWTANRSIFSSKVSQPLDLLLLSFFLSKQQNYLEERKGEMRMMREKVEQIIWI